MFLLESTKTQEEKRQEERETSKPGQSYEVADDEAITYAMQGIQAITNKASQMTGRDCRLPEQGQFIAALAFAPLVQKYGKHVKRYLANMSESVDTNSNQPEYMAGIGAVGVAGWVLIKARKGKPVKVVQKDGN